MTDDQRRKEFGELLEQAKLDYGIQIAPSLNYVFVQEISQGVSIGYYKPIPGIQFVLVPGWKAPIEEEDHGDDTTDTTRNQPDDQG